MAGLGDMIMGPEGLRILGVRLLAVKPEIGRKLLLTLVCVVASLAIGWALRALFGWLARAIRAERLGFWARQAISLLVAALVILGVVSIWFDEPARLATAAGLVTAGIAFALQRVI